MSDQFHCQAAKAEVIEVPAGVTRRAALTVFAAALATAGFSSASESAYAAAKTYNACKTTDIKVGSARMFSIGGKAVVITQPKKGIFRAFYGNCTHQGALLAPNVGLVKTQGTSLVCPQHGAKFDTTSGKATAGPASRGLLTIKVSVVKTQVKVTL